MNKYIINASSILINDSNQQVIHDIAHDLQLIKKLNPNIDQIIVRGGCALDVILGLEPNDVDLFYCYKTNDIPTSKCVCDEVRKNIQSIKFKYLKNKSIDLENSYEKEPYDNPIERTVGLFNFNTEYNSQFAIDINGNIWTNVEALKYHLNNVYEIRYEGCLPWAYFPREEDILNYFDFQFLMLIRGIGYIIKRSMIPGEKFLLLLSASEYLFDKSTKYIGIDKFKDLATKKIKNVENLNQFIESFASVEDITKLKNLYGKLFDL